MARLNCTFKWQWLGKSEKVKRQKCTFKWQKTIARKKCVRLNGKEKVYVKWQDKSLRLNGKEKVYV